MIQVFIESIIGVMVLMLFFFILAQLLKDNSIVDIAWGLGYVLVAVLTFFRFSSDSYVNILLTFFVTLWGLRLAIYIFYRNRGKGEDFRYKAMRKKWGQFVLIKSFFYIFIFQGMLLLIIALPIMFVNGTSLLRLGIPHFIGITLFSIGFFFEVVSDWQLTQFKRLPENKGKLMTTGLWRLSRHPNYFGEALVWWGIFCFAVTLPMGWITIISPIFISYLLIFFSGVPLLEKKYAGGVDFEEYKKKTPIFFPFIPWY
jgi:steroid 5-alpha reductase family enzyme